MKTKSYIISDCQYDTLQVPIQNDCDMFIATYTVQSDGSIYSVDFDRYFSTLSKLEEFIHIVK